MPSLVKGKSVHASEALGLKKMSAIILDLAEDLLEDSYDPLQIQKAIQLTICAWNLAVLDEAMREQAQKELIIQLGLDQDKEAEAEFRSILQDLIAKKNVFYPDDKRIIVNFKLDTTSAENLNLTIASHLPDDIMNQNKN